MGGTSSSAAMVAEQAADLVLAHDLHVVREEHSG
jgi:hypothetical protein